MPVWNPFAGARLLGFAPAARASVNLDWLWTRTCTVLEHLFDNSAMNESGCGPSSP